VSAEVATAGVPPTPETYWNWGAGGANMTSVKKSTYSTLVRIDLTDRVLCLPCTLYLWHATDSAEFKTQVSTVKGVWENGGSTAMPEEGAVCWKYRAYSATPELAVLWDPENPNSTMGAVSGGAGLSHINSTGVVWNTKSSGLISYIVLDSALCYDLVNGFGGLRIARDPMESRTQDKIYWSNGTKQILLGWDPTTGRTVPSAVETSLPKANASLTSMNSPNPFTPSTSILYQGGNLPVRIYDLAGNLVTTVNGQNGRAVWNGTNSRGVSVAAGIYVYRINNGRNVISNRMTLTR